MATQLVPVRDDPDAAVVEQVLISGNLAQLTPAQRVTYYRAVCKSLGLNHLTKPFEYMTLNGKLVLYAKKDCAEQLRERDGVSVTRLDKEEVGGVYVVTAYVRNQKGREDSDVGAVSIEGLKGEAKSNAIMKAITKAKRRATLSICGLGFLDETEIDSIPDARPVKVDVETGVIEGEVINTLPAFDRAQARKDYARLYGKAVELGHPPTDKRGEPMPADMPDAWPDTACQRALERVRGIVEQAEPQAA